MFPMMNSNRTAAAWCAVVLAAIAGAATHGQDGQDGQDGGEESARPRYPELSMGWSLVGAIRHAQLKEASGFAASRAVPGILWTHNDGGAGSNVFAVDVATGEVVQTVPVPEVPNLDWEDAFAVHRNGRDYLAIADIGDNEKRRVDCAIHLFAERKAGEGRPPVLVLQTSVRFRYAGGGRHDAEAAAFDPHRGTFLVLTKSKVETLLFEVPFPSPANREQVIEATLLAALAKPVDYPEAGAVVSLKRGIFGTSATAADVSPDGGMLAVLTYTECLLYRRAAAGGGEAEGGEWSEAVSRPPQVLPLPAVYQAESLCFSTDGSTLFVTSENSPSPLYRIAVPDAAPAQPSCAPAR